MALLLAALSVIVAGVGGFLLARRQGELAHRRGELELATMRAQTAAIERRLLELRQAEERASQAASALAEAKAHLAAAERRAVELQGAEARAAQAAEALADLRAQLTAAERRATELQGAEARAAESGQLLAQLRAQLAAAERRATELQGAEARAAQSAEALADLRAQLTAAERRATELQGAEARAAQSAEALAELRAQVTALEGRLREFSGLDERAAQLAEALGRAESSLAAERAMAAERLAAVEQGRAAMRNELDLMGRSMLEQSQEGLAAVLEPIHERLREFEEKVKTSYDADNRDRGALLEKLRGLQEAQTRLHADAQALTRALTGDNRAQGDWGELVLESLLSTAGLTEGREYALQVDHRDDDGGHRRPDAVIYLPPDRALVIDSKCSLTAFAESTRTPDEALREAALEAHVVSLRNHVRGLSAKDYHRLLGERTLDLVLLFVPSEAAFHAAVSRDPQLYEDAFRQRVVLTSPTTLLATLQVVNHVWRSERQTQNARRIAQEAGKMIEKLTLGLEAFDEVGDRLEKAHAAFEDARKRLVTGRGNVLALAGKVAQLGARPPHPERMVAVGQRLEAELDDDELIAALEAETGGDESEQLELVPSGGPTR